MTIREWIDRVRLAGYPKVLEVSPEELDDYAQLCNQRSDRYIVFGVKYDYCLGTQLVARRYPPELAVEEGL